MLVYIDYIFIENLLYNLVIILQTSFLSRFKINKKRNIFASLIGSIYVCIMVLLKMDFLNYFWCKVALSFVIVFVAFKPKNIGNYLKLIGIYYLATIINVGGCIVVSQMLVKTEKINIITKTVVYIVSLTATYMYTKQFWKIYKTSLSKKELIKKVILNIQDNVYIYNGFLDTGNTVKSYELNVPIIFAEYLSLEQKQIIKKQPQYVVNVSTIIKQGQEKAIYVKNAKVGNKYVDVGVVFVDGRLNKNNKYNMILNFELFEDSLGGIHI